jgi:putative transposase
MMKIEHKLSVSSRCELLEVSRGFAYYKAVDLGEKYKDTIRLIDEIHLEIPEFGQRGIRDMLEFEGVYIGRDLVRTLMQHMGMCSISPKAKTTIPGGKEHKIHPYLLGNIDILRPNQVWTTDITYVPMGKGYMYLVAVMDWCSRKVLSWRISNTLDTDFCIEALEEALENYGPPEIFNTDQGCQFTSREFTGILTDNGVRISMDGKGRWVDNVIMERFWRTIKYGDIYAREYQNGQDLYTGIKNYILLYNSRRTHSSLEKRTPDEAYFQMTDPRRKKIKKTG